MFVIQWGQRTVNVWQNNVRVPCERYYRKK